MPKNCFTNKDIQGIGNLGERLALNFLLSKKYQLIEKNFRKRGGQIDLIMSKGNEMIFVEVKTRTVNYFGMEEDALSNRQLKILMRTGLFYLRNCPLKSVKPVIHFKKIRFDLVTIDLSHYSNEGSGKIRHYQDLLRYADF